MRRRTLLAGLGSTPVALAGCLTDGTPLDDGPDGDGGDGGDGTPTATPAPGTVADAFDGDPERPDCKRDAERIEVEVDGETRTYRTASTRPYPDAPDAVTGDAVVDYVTAFEEAYLTKDVLCGRRGSSHVVDIGFGVDRTERIERDDGIEGVHLRYAGGATRGVDDEGYEWVADLAYTSVVYAVDATGAARAPFEDAHEYDPDEVAVHAPAPLDKGTLVAEFG